MPKNYQITLENSSVNAVIPVNEKPAVENPFTDVAEGSYCYDAVLWAVENGITKGLTETTFGPKENCSRGQSSPCCIVQPVSPTYPI